MNKSPSIEFFDRNGLSVKLLPSSTWWAVPEPVRSSLAVQRKLKELKERCAEGTLFDGTVQVTVDVSQDAWGNVIIRTQRSSYCMAIACSEYFKTPESQAQGIAGAALGIDTLVISNEGKVLVTRRSPTMGKWPGFYSVALGEGIDSQDEGLLVNAAHRCLREELGLVLSEEHKQCVKIVAVAVEQEHFSWSAFAIADFRGQGAAFSAQALLEEATKASDAWESSESWFADGAQLVSLLNRECTPSTLLLVPFILRQLSRPGL